ncbi:MAG: LacI family transcriptional regulator [Acidimicrobiaceae bacterium]|nr:LacI family DNA-binding transcriptional regulator [Acidimicrobiaceae bacterium]MCY3643670.1 LacI family DNA-binding transcriptional regulator [Acidimicrobiaceae bacterium]MDE0666318.1 LacI family DNA-binding transcriptional regulator [Acidimicrobiaceae bacterium]MXY09565.1 LacI family transcriptional regulator [Acidimicrobiaceae bacterium]MXZ67236.1 LacI family transcriptional regulator [Acidimicrobiaceae bacterium]
MADGRPTIKDIAREAGVSVATVSRALRDLPYVAPATRSRVVEVAAELEYEVHPHAARLVSGRTWTIGLAAPQFGSWFPSRALGGINSVFAEAGYDLLVSMMATPEDRQRFLVEARSFCRRVDGIVLIDTFVSAEGSSAGDFFDRPVVAVNERLEGASSIIIDNRLAARRAVEHLIDLGHERIGLVVGPSLVDLPTPVPEQRGLGYRDALRSAGLPFDPELAVSGQWTAAGGFAALSKLLEGHEPPTAVFCMSDQMAFGALWAATRHGLDIPGDLSVIGFDDHDLSAAMGLTTMRQAVDEMGVRAAATVLALIEGEPVTDITWDVPLIVRETTAKAG